MMVAIVDDEEHVRVALRRLCAAWGLEARAFASAPELLESLTATLPDCLVLDVHMPGVTGLDALAWMRARGTRIPAIVITGRDDEEVRIRATAVGAAAYLCKPIDPEVLLDAIADATAPTARQAS
jgi:FixJ family two-component response regulator